MFTSFINFFRKATKKTDKIKELEINQQVLISYIVALSRLMFITPGALRREQKNLKSNNEFITHLYKKDEKDEKNKDIKT